MDEARPAELAVRGAVCRARTNSVPFPEPVTLLGEIMSLYADCVEVPLALALLGEVCSSVDDSLPLPVPVAATPIVLSLVTDDVPLPAADAVLGDMCSPRALSPAVAEPEAVAARGSTCTDMAVDVEVP